MQDLENNMEELFRRAAENYSPKKGESQWNKILPALQDNIANNPANISTFKKTNRKKYAGLLSLLLLLALSAGVFVKFFNNKNETAQLNTPSEKNNQINSETQLHQSNKKTITSYKKQDTENKVNNKKNYALIKENENEIVSNQQGITQANIEKGFSNEAINEIKIDDKNLSVKQNDLSNKTVNQLNSFDTVKSPGIKNSISLQKQHGIYIAVIAGPAFSEVKSQGIRKLGFDAGIIAGYRFSTKASVETGLLVSKKKYFSDGKYFSMDKMPPGMKVISLEGSSTMLEIPLKFKYDVLRKKNAALFSSAGISSYIMTGEKNDYLILSNGAERKMKASYNNATKYFAAVAELSIGYENKIGKHTDIRIEPYLQIPLKGIGIGSMPVSSAGLHVGIVKFMP